MTYANKRYIVYFLIFLVVFSTPFIQIDGNQIFLLSFDHKELHLLGVRFSVQELYLMPFLVMLIFIGLFFVTGSFGRVWCGWGCPQTMFRAIYRDFIQTKLLKLRRNVKNKQKDIDYSKKGNKLKQFIAVMIWSVLAFVASANFLWYFIPPAEFFTYLQEPMEHKILMGFFVALAVFLIYDVTKLAEDFCAYICPYGRVQSIMYDKNTLTSVYNPARGGKIFDEKSKKVVFKIADLENKTDECITCEACVRICPTHIDIRKGMQLECVECLECVDACTAVMGGKGEETLISWDSSSTILDNNPTKFWRKKNIGYLAVLSFVLFLLFYNASKKEFMQLNINRTSQLYTIKPNNIVQNSYIFLFENTTSKDHVYYFELDNKDIKIKRPTKPFRLKANAKTKQIIILYTDKKLANDKTKDTILHLGIKAYSVDDNNITVNRETIFAYPKAK